jgi:hypothetical protein
LALPDNWTTEVNMPHLARTFAAAAAALPFLVTNSEGQVLRDLPPLELEYALYHGDPAVGIGSATASFRTIDTPRGKRLEVRARTEYTLPRTPPYVYEEEATLLCDAKGVARFETVARALGDERVNTGVRMGSEYQVTTTFRGKRNSNTITAGVQRSNFGLYCAAYLDERLDEGGLFDDFPLLFPVAGTHMARQLFREGTLPFQLAKGREIPASLCRLEALDKTSDKIFNTVSGHRLLLRMEETSNLGTIIYELVGVNGVAPAESEWVQ